MWQGFFASPFPLRVRSASMAFCKKQVDSWKMGRSMAREKDYGGVTVRKRKSKIKQKQNQAEE
ncbi:hypothetical protein X777_08731 [Ooceraea biroi]|uniref:Uncharacterized protein n=1 Tax=Ooceraea biroi TaxID=2015173 RepID=A0A026W8C7_OOCBI|nr:hypothetical protein X777_08731 [Ooceraea biroi]